MSQEKPDCMADFDPESLSIEQALTLVRNLAPEVSDTESLPLTEAYGRTLASDLRSPVDVPAARNSAMDGYAVRFEDLNMSGETRLSLIGKSLAGHPFNHAVNPDTAVRITTGALIPDEADCIIMQEHVELDSDTLIIPQRSHKKGQHVREAGSDIRNGSTVVSAGSYLEAAELGLAAATGHSHVEVYRKLTAAVFSTGDELVTPGENPGHGQIYDSNRYTLTGLLHQAGVQVLDLGIVSDTPDAVRDAFKRAADCDLVISTGGVSVGEADYIRQILEESGELHGWKVAMKPGRPLTVGKLSDDCLFFGLPGNPVSGMVTFHLFVAEALRKMQTRPARELLSFNAICQSQLKKLPGRVEFQRGLLSRNENSDWTVSTTGLQDSHVLTSMHKANCFIVLPLEASGANVGDNVEVIPFETLGSAG